MKAFWWFDENKIAGMARPGFNCTSWYDFPADEAMVMSWLGQFDSSQISLENYKKHLLNYIPKVSEFYRLNGPLEEMVAQFLSPYKIREALEKVVRRTKMISNFEVKQNFVHVEYCSKRMNFEIDFLKSKKIERIVCLTENHLGSDSLKDHFQLYHFSINDMGAPSKEQAEALAKVIAECRAESQTLGVHCMAGIGRTSTMLIAAHIILGEKYDDLKKLITNVNPRFKIVGSQGEFLENINQQYS